MDNVSYSLLDKENSYKILRHGSRSTCEKWIGGAMCVSLCCNNGYTVYQFGRFLLIALPRQLKVKLQNLYQKAKVPNNLGRLPVADRFFF